MFPRRTQGEVADQGLPFTGKMAVKWKFFSHNLLSSCAFLSSSKSVVILFSVFFFYSGLIFFVLKSKR